METAVDALCSYQNIGGTVRLFVSDSVLSCTRYFGTECCFDLNTENELFDRPKACCCLCVIRSKAQFQLTHYFGKSHWRALVRYAYAQYVLELISIQS